MTMQCRNTLAELINDQNTGLTEQEEHELRAELNSNKDKAMRELLEDDDEIIDTVIDMRDEFKDALVLSPSNISVKDVDKMPADEIRYYAKNMISLIEKFDYLVKNKVEARAFELLNN